MPPLWLLLCLRPSVLQDCLPQTHADWTAESASHRLNRQMLYRCCAAFNSNIVDHFFLYWQECPQPQSNWVLVQNITYSPVTVHHWHQVPHRCPLGAGTSQTRDTHAAPGGSHAAVDLERPTRPENSAQQLQRQVAQAATAAGVPVEQIASHSARLEPVMLAESWQDIVKRVQQLQQDAVPLAERVKASVQHA